MSFRCSDAARERADPMIGTAPPQRRWVLVEHPGPWPVLAPFDAGISADLLARLGHPSVRVVLVRRPGRQSAAATRAWAVAEPGQPLRWGTWREPNDLLAVLDPTESLPTESATTESATTESVTTGPTMALLVCAHGVHDVCCAVRGRPVAAALAKRWPAQVWECSHVGGDRFAANLLVFPDGVCYGDLDADSALSTMAAHLAGQLVTPRLRGLVGLPAAGQVAVAAVHEHFGPAPVSAARVEKLQPRDAGWQVVVAGTPPLPNRSVVRVESLRRSAARLTCRVDHETSAFAYSVTDLQIVAA